MVAILGGLGAAVVFAIGTLCNSRSSRMIGPSALLGWVMLLGLAIIAVPVAVDGIPDGLDAESLGWMAVAGIGNVVGLLLAYAALRLGKVGLVAPVVSTQGAIAAVIAVIAGESISPGVGVLLAVIALGVFLAGSSEDLAETGQQSCPCARTKTLWRVTVLREQVTSPAGTTAAALAVLMAADGLDPLMEKAVAAATKRSRELAG